MIRLKNVLLITFVMTITLPMALHAQKKVLDGVVIEKKTIWKGTVHLRGDVIVKKNAKLIIEGGTKILFEPNTDVTKGGKDKTKSEIIVEGIIDVQGDMYKKVLFTSASTKPRMGDWYGITIINSSVASIIEYAVFEYAYNAISTKRSRPQIRKCQVHYNYNAGMLFEVKSNPKVIENIITENGYAGIICKLGSKPILSGNLIALNQIGVVILSSSSPNLGNLTKGKNYNIGMNDIRDNEEYNIYNHSSSKIFAENNSWGTTSIAKIKKMNYGSIQNSKYGEIKIEPLMQTEQDKTELMALTQQQTPAAADNPAASASASKQQTKKEQKQEKNNEKKALSAAAGGALAGNAKKTINNKPSVKESSKSAEPSTAEKTAEKPSEVKKESAAKPVAAAATVKKETKPEIPSIDYNQVFLEPLLDSKKRQVVKQVAPEVTDAMRRILVSGRVIVRVVVGKDGRVETAQILRGINDLYDEKCVEAAKKFIFKPGKVKGVPVRFSTNLFFRFGTGK